MKLPSLALGLALAVAGSSFAATVTHERTVTRTTPNGTVTKHVVRTSDRPVVRKSTKHVVVVKNKSHRHHAKKVVVVHPERHGPDVENRTVVIHKRG